MKRGAGAVGVAILLAFIIGGCANYTIPDNSRKIISANSCEGCHTDYDRLVEVHDTNYPPPMGGCGGSAPFYFPYERVYLGGDGYEAFKASGHYSMNCTDCHNGNGETGDKLEAHSGEWTSTPSLLHEEKCASCHDTESHGFTTSIHNGTGQKRKVTMRAGLEGAHQFDMLPEHHQEAYDAKCATCHGTCGNCHVVRPKIKGGGLTQGHNFVKEPDWYNVCVGCHVSRGGHAFLGTGWTDDDTQVEPDVHRSSGKMDCLDCHDGMELHGDGKPVDQRYAYEGLPTCEKCHGDITQATDDSKDSYKYHTKHGGEFSCYVCHSQPYNSCGACHVKDGHAELPSHADFKIALNPIPDVKTGEKFALVRRTLGHPDNWVGYGEDLAYENFDVFPIFNYTTPHNILARTAQTTPAEGMGCGSSCHIRNESGTLVNTELYLWADSLDAWAYESTVGITVDGELPGSWFEPKGN